MLTPALLCRELVQRARDVAGAWVALARGELFPPAPPAYERPTLERLERGFARTARLVERELIARQLEGLRYDRQDLAASVWDERAKWLTEAIDLVRAGGAR